MKMFNKKSLSEIKQEKEEKQIQMLTDLYEGMADMYESVTKLTNKVETLENKIKALEAK